MLGIVRKIDELGRIVIPKEIRKSLALKSNDDLEIKSIDDKIILEKYYKLETLKNILSEYYLILEKNLSCKYIITDKEKIIVSSKNEHTNIKINKITSSFLELINERKEKSNNGSINITKDLIINNNYYFFPIIIDTDSVGSMIIYDENKIAEKDFIISSIIVQLIKQKLEC